MVGIPISRDGPVLAFQNLETDPVFPIWSSAPAKKRTAHRGTAQVQQIERRSCLGIAECVSREPIRNALHVPWSTPTTCAGIKSPAEKLVIVVVPSSTVS